MKAYKITYKSSDGVISDTILGEPMASFNLSGFDSLELIKSFFHLIHPDCKIISCVLYSF